MIDEAALAEEVHALIEPLHRRLHELGYRLAGIELVKADNGARHSFADCSTSCGWQPDGTFGCRTHCP
jgi:hypothetical protein